MSTDARVPAPTLNREQTASLFGRTMVLVGVTAGFFAVGAYLARGISQAWGWGFLVAAVVALFALEAVVDRSESAALAVLSAFGVLFGAALAPTVGYYAGADPQTLVLAAVATGLRARVDPASRARQAVVVDGEDVPISARDVVMLTTVDERGRRCR